jgi:hypothetical protein
LGSTPSAILSSQCDASRNFELVSNSLAISVISSIAASFRHEIQNKRCDAAITQILAKSMARIAYTAADNICCNPEIYILPMNSQKHYRIFIKSIKDKFKYISPMARSKYLLRSLFFS